MKQTIFSFLLMLITLTAVSQEISVRALTTIKTPSALIQFEYNKKGQVIAETRKGIGDDYLNYHFEYEYDDFGNIILLKKQDINFFHQEENIYNDNNQIVVKKIFEDYGSGLRFIKQNLYTYREGLLDTVLEQTVSYNGEQINNNTKQIFTYNGKDITINKYDWVMGENWIHSEIFSYEHNEYDDLIYYSKEESIENEFVKAWRYEFRYNSDRELIERTRCLSSGSDWSSARPADKYLYYYEPITKDEPVLYPNIYQFDALNFNWFQPDNILRKDDYWLSDCGGTLHFEESADYIYEMIIIGQNPEEGIKNCNKDEFVIYPNPTTGELRIENGEWRIENIEIYDIYGKKQKCRSAENSPPFMEGWQPQADGVVNISHLPTGIYFVKITTSTGQIVKKVVKQ